MNKLNCFEKLVDSLTVTGTHRLAIFPLAAERLTAGINILVAKKDIIELDVTSESALQYVLTAGAIMPEAGTAPKV